MQEIVFKFVKVKCLSYINGNATNYIWHPSDSVISPTNNSTYIFPTTSMTYYVYNSNDHCISYDSVFVEVLEDIPEAFFTAENFCENDTTLFTGTSNLINLIFIITGVLVNLEKM